MDVPYRCVRRCLSLKSIMRGSQSRSNTYVANATGMPIRVLLEVGEMRLEDIVQQVVVQGSTGDGVGGPAEMKMIFKNDSRVRFISVPANNWLLIKGEGSIYVSVFVESCSCSHICEKTICLNCHITSDRSFIMSKEQVVRLQKYGANIWEDESGKRHDSF